MNKPAFIFDLDGVLTETAEYHFHAWKSIADELGIPFDRVANEKLRGVSREDSLRAMLNGRTLPEDQFRESLKRKNALYVDSLAGAGEEILIRGAREFLAGCAEIGIRTAIASSSKNAPEIVRKAGIADLVGGLTCGSDVHRTKPAPDLFIHAAGRLGAATSDCAVFEDAQAGIAAAHAAGMLAVGVGSAQVLAEADWVVPGLWATTPRAALDALASLRVK